MSAAGRGALPHAGDARRYRDEWKYVVTRAELAELECRLLRAMRPDPHADAGGRYAVRSLYFDDVASACARATEAGLFNRFKYRIRYYGGEGRPLALHLERKEKAGGFGFKRTCPLTLRQYELLTRGDYPSVLYGADDPLLRLFCVDGMTRGFAPRVIIDYERTAFVEAAGNVRVTLDQNLSASRALDAFLTGDYPRLPLLPAGRHVLEVKFDGLLPGHVKRAVFSKHLQQTSFSKYVLGLRATGGFQ